MTHSSGNGSGASDDSLLTGRRMSGLDPLELLADVQLGSVEIDPIPGEPEYLALAQAQDDDENVSGVQRITVATGRLQEPACFIDSPDAALTFPWCWQPDDGYRIAGDDNPYAETGTFHGTVA